MAWDLVGLFGLNLGRWPTYGLFFLLGSFAVATLSDVRRLSAQREFPEIWVTFTLGLLGFDLYGANGRWSALLLLKWGLVLVLSLLSWQRIGVLFRLAAADVAACAAAASLLAPGAVVLFWVVLKLASWMEGPLLARGRTAYAFMPVVLTATLAVLAISWLVVPAVASTR